jgi:hypothetical protein
VLRNPIGWVGFTGATGGLSATIDILNWQWTSPPTLVNYMGLNGRSQNGYGYPGPGLSVSSSGPRNGILWAIQADGYGSNAPAVLHAYDATNLNRELYNSAILPARDTAGGSVKFSVPTVADGRVFVGGSSSVTVYGLLSAP